MASERMLKVNELLYHKISEYIAKEVEMPSGVFVTLSRVETSPDLRHARVFISVIPDNKRGTGLRLLKKHQGKIKRKLAQYLQMKFTPNPTFVIDGQVIYGNEIDRLLDSIKETSDHLNEDFDEMDDQEEFENNNSQ